MNAQRLKLGSRRNYANLRAESFSHFSATMTSILAICLTLFIGRGRCGLLRMHTFLALRTASLNCGQIW